jgi:plastocyanin
VTRRVRIDQQLDCEEHHIMTRITRTLATLGILAAAACDSSYGGNGGVSSPPPPPSGRTIAATPSLTFGPDSLIANVGDAVTFAFGSVPHNVFFDATTGAPADIGGANANISIERTFATPGTFTYTCHIHPFMRGKVVVR